VTTKFDGKLQLNHYWHLEISLGLQYSIYWLYRVRENRTPECCRTFTPKETETTLDKALDVKLKATLVAGYR